MRAAIIRFLCLLAWLVPALVLPGCGESGFTVDGIIDGVPDRAVTIAYVGDGGVTSRQVALGQGNAFSFEGSSADYTLLFIWDSRGQLIAQMVVRDGDRLTVKSDGLQLPTPQVAGNKPTEQWMKFRRDNHDAFITHDSRAIDDLIVRQVEEHPDQLLSTVLLVAEYSRLDDTPRMSALLRALAPEARPQRMVNGLELLIAQQKRQPETLADLTLYRQGKGVEDLTLRGRPAVLLLWSRHDPRRRACVDTLRSLSRRYGDRLLVADVLIDADSASWSAVTRGDSAAWPHYWAPGGGMDPMLQGLCVARTPLLVATDSMSRIVTLSGDPAQLGME